MKNQVEELRELIIKEVKLKPNCPVSERVKMTQQPYGGYLPPKNMEKIKLGEGNEKLNQNENIHSSLIGLSVDYLTRFRLGTPLQKAFFASMLGAAKISKEREAKRLMNDINGLDNISIISAVKLSGFDVCYRAGKSYYKPIEDIEPNQATIDNIKIMVMRALTFFDTYGPVVMDGFRFDGGYTPNVTAGDGDYLTADTLWDMKVTNSPVTIKHTLQLLIYWRMGIHSKNSSKFQEIKYLGICNPRQNIAMRIPVANVSQEIVEEVDTKIIGYDKKQMSENIMKTSS